MKGEREEKRDLYESSTGAAPYSAPCTSRIATQKFQSNALIFNKDAANNKYY